MAESSERPCTLYSGNAMDLVTRPILEIRSVLEITERRVAPGRTIRGSLMSSSKTRRTMELCAVRLDLTLVELPLSVIEGLVGGFQGTVVSGKLPKSLRQHHGPKMNFVHPPRGPNVNIFKKGAKM